MKLDRQQKIKEEVTGNKSSQAERNPILLNQLVCVTPARTRHPLIKKVAAYSADFAVNLIGGFEKSWIFDKKDLVPGQDSEDIVRIGDKKRIAFQNKFHVRINEQLYDSVPIEVRVQLIIHELVRNLAIAKGGISEYSIREITRTIFSNPIAQSPEALIQKLAAHGLGDYSVTPGLMEKAVSAVRQNYTELCLSSQDELQNKIQDPEFRLRYAKLDHVLVNAAFSVIDYSKFKSSRTEAFIIYRQLSKVTDTSLQLATYGLIGARAGTSFEIARQFRESCPAMKAVIDLQPLYNPTR